MAVCSVCKKRPAVYYRRFSGDRLCMPCLRKQLLKAVKKSLGAPGLLKPRQVVGVLISPIAPLHSIALADLVYRVEKSYGSTIKILHMDNVELSEDTQRLVSRLGEVIRVEAPRVKEAGLVECMRLDRGLAGAAARMHGVNAVILPYTRSHLAMAGLEALLGEWWYWSEALDRWSGLVPMIAGLSSIEAEAASAYSFLIGADAVPRCRVNLAAGRLFKRVASNRPELVYSSSKTIDLLAGASGRRGTICRICGGYSSAQVCSVCSRYGLDRLVGRSG